MKESIEDMPDVIWVKVFKGWKSGRWYASEMPDTDKYVKADDQGEIYAWWFSYAEDRPKHGYFRSERREAINATVGYRKAD